MVGDYVIDPRIFEKVINLSIREPSCIATRSIVIDVFRGIAVL